MNMRWKREIDEKKFNENIFMIGEPVYKQLWIN